MSAQSDKKQTTLSSLKKMKEQGEKFTCLTSYESTLTSKICDAGVDVVLVGVADVTTVPVDLSLSADTEDIISILSTVADEINISLSSELI